MSISCCTIALYIDCTYYMVQTCLYMFMPCGQDSRWKVFCQLETDSESSRLRVLLVTVTVHWQ